MTSRILTACAIAALTVGTEARAQDLPAWTPQSICAEDATPEHCGFLEGQARAQISQQWQFIPTLVRERCIADSGEQDTQSWRLFGECLATAARPPQGQDNGEFVQARAVSEVSEENLAEIAAIRAELDAARARVEELDAAQAASIQSASGAAARLTALEEELEQAEARRTEGESRIAELQQQLTAATAAAAAAQLAASDEAEAGMADMRSSLDEATARAEGAELRVSTLEQDLAAAFADAEAARNEAGEAENARITELEEALAKADAEANLANVRIEGLQARLVEMSDAADAEPEQNSEQIAALEASLASAEAENQRSATEVQALRARIVELMDALMTDEPAEQDAPDATRISELEALLADAEARVEELAAAEPAASVNDERIAELEASLASAQTEVQRSNARIEGLQARLVEAMDTATASEEPAVPDAGASDAQVAELEASLATAQGEVERLTGRIEGLQGRLISTRNSVAQSRAAFGDATATIAEKDAQIATLETDLAKAQSDMRSREVRIEGLQQRLMEAADAQEADSAGADETAALEARLKVAESRIDNLTTRLRNARDVGKVAQSEKRRAEDNLAMARERITALQDTMTEEREAAQAREATGGEARNEAIASAERLQALLDNQRERSARVADTVSEQRDRIAALETELRDARRAAQNAVVQTAEIQPVEEPVIQPSAALASCARQMEEILADDGIQFAINTAEIRADAIGVIDEIIAVANTCEDARITIRGHTDAIGERSYNIYLSQLRADAVVDYMERNGIAPDRVDGVGVGPDEPLADNRTRAGRAANRRIEIVVE